MYAETAGPYAVYGVASAPASEGVRGESSANHGIGVRGLGNTGVRGDGETGVKGFGNSTGVFGRSDDGMGVHGQGYSAGSGTSYGVYGTSSGYTGIGVFGGAINIGTSQINYGGRFESSSPVGRGVFGLALSSTGVSYAVRGQSMSASGYGVYAAGDFGASGTKAFRIDHPFDPENKYLLHYASESPVPQNFYVGNVVTDSKGYAWVDLPDYFSEINTNFKYQLTVVRDDESPNFVQVQVGKKIKGNRFLIMSSAPNTEVSWRVDADRNDLYVRNRPPKEVVDKEGPEKGRYQHPEDYGHGPERGMDYDASRDKNKAKSPPEAAARSRSK